MRGPSWPAPGWRGLWLNRTPAVLGWGGGSSSAMSRWWLGPIGVAVLLGGGCSAEPVDLINHHRWSVVGPDEDPWAEERPSDVLCPAEAIYVEGETPDTEVLEIDTGACNYVTLMQPALSSVDVQDGIVMSLWHSTLLSEETAEAHVAIRLGTQLLWEKRVPIPSPNVAFNERLSAPIALNPGDPIYLHLHNHGSNTWNFYELRADGKP